MEYALEDKIIIAREGFLIRSKLNDISNDYMSKEVNDSILTYFKSHYAEKEKGFSWSETELENKIILNPDQKIDLKLVSSLLKTDDEKSKKEILKEYKKYNRGDTFYRNFPFGVSRPIYNKEKTLAIIGFSRGNNGGEIILYKIVDGKWKILGYLMRWAY